MPAASAPPPAAPRGRRAAPATVEARPAAKSALKPLSAPQRAMERLGLTRPIDLALHLPLRYEDETRLTAIAAARPGETVQVEGTVREAQVELRGRRQLLVRLADASGSLMLRFLHFYPAQQKLMAPGARLRVRGELRGGFFGPEMVHPAVKAVTDDTPLAAALTPVYPAGAQLPQAYLRKAVAAGLARAPLDEILPPGMVPAGLPTLREALRFLHHPAPEVALATLEDHSHPAWQRLKFEELLAQQLAQLQARRERARQRAPALRGRPGGLHERLLATLPFALTGAQRRCAEEIAADLAGLPPPGADTQASAGPSPMHRLLQGDVGSGKTVVAALAAAIALDAGWQCALMAPTEILAEQHARKLVDWLVPLGVGVAWLSGSRKGKARQAELARVASGAAQLVVGTHAVIQDEVHFARLGLAIVDEQHRFGVAQRLALRRKLAGDEPALDAVGRPAAARGTAPGSAHESRLEPHLLMMSATPIPRTLAMTLFADLDLSTLDELPPGRTPIVTKVLAEAKREAVIERIRDEVAQGRQVYWVCPLIGETDEAEAELPAVEPPPRPRTRRGASAVVGEPPELRDVIATHAELCEALGGAAPRGRASPSDRTDQPGLTADITPEPRAEVAPAADAAQPAPLVGLIHGRLPAAEKVAVMADFAAGRTRLLVATTVIEVGVDVPNASLMVIEHAERFGLAQLHQLRGRVGRGSVASVCVLIYSPPLSPTGRERLKAMAETTDGFEIARRDLQIRGPGEFLGARQSGVALLRFADLEEDSALLQQARELAPRLAQRDPRTAQAQIDRWLGSRQEFMKA
ncbi:ATP-dependent DNA helicase RecG [Piscinibacter sp. Jin2]|uniref:Probable DNA 3'-5' helicase RecG n=1 Tax=Aquariibacter lacus TaxID=2801332 RepID=A0A9X0XEV0_9BURK|nr:ATP-dependent DNA helicase RecG [Piscinibacter lacus]